jgi:hypothetical protein
VWRRRPAGIPARSTGSGDAPGQPARMPALVMLYEVFFDAKKIQSTPAKFIRMIIRSL